MVLGGAGRLEGEGERGERGGAAVGRLGRVRSTGGVREEDAASAAGGEGAVGGFLVYPGGKERRRAGRCPAQGAGFLVYPGVREKTERDGTGQISRGSAARFRDNTGWQGR